MIFEIIQDTLRGMKIILSKKISISYLKLKLSALRATVYPQFFSFKLCNISLPKNNHAKKGNKITYYIRYYNF